MTEIIYNHTTSWWLNILALNICHGNKHKFKGTISSRSEQGIESENYLLIYAAAMVILGYYFQSLSYFKTSTPIPCPVDRDDNCPFNTIWMIEKLTWGFWSRPETDQQLGYLSESGYPERKREDDTMVWHPLPKSSLIGCSWTDIKINGIWSQ